MTFDEFQDNIYKEIRIRKKELKKILDLLIKEERDKSLFSNKLLEILSFYTFVYIETYIKKVLSLTLYYVFSNSDKLEDYKEHHKILAIYIKNENDILNNLSLKKIFNIYKSLNYDETIIFKEKFIEKFIDNNINLNIRDNNIDLKFIYDILKLIYNHSFIQFYENFLTELKNIRNIVGHSITHKYFDKEIIGRLSKIEAPPMEIEKKINKCSLMLKKEIFQNQNTTINAENALYIYCAFELFLEEFKDYTLDFYVKKENFMISI